MLGVFSWKKSDWASRGLCKTALYHAAAQPTSRPILKCHYAHFAVEKDPWPWLSCKTPNWDGSCKPKKLRLTFFCPSCPGNAQQETVLRVKTGSSAAKGISWAIAQFQPVFQQAMVDLTLSTTSSSLAGQVGISKLLRTSPINTPGPRHINTEIS